MEQFEIRGISGMECVLMVAHESELGTFGGQIRIGEVEGEYFRHLLEGTGGSRKKSCVNSIRKDEFGGALIGTPGLASSAI